ncbi:MAG: hypothetical protein RMI91_04965 [Gemmatales bacterium]|nr:zinc ribbon domain-containing protein [Gemmatales bacterium]MDW7993987.1 hypothetical protein [Gemmatales bacterium]
MSDIRFCPRCRRANPAEAAFCYFDGQDLRFVQAGISEPWELGREFTFPSGRRCRTFDEFVQACAAEWSAACKLLREGAFQQFFAAIGRGDVAHAAWEILRRNADLEEALDEFLSTLPTQVPIRPELDYSPRKLQFGRLSVGQRRTLVLRISNKGHRLLRGRLRVEETGWLEVRGVEPVRDTVERPRNVQGDDIPVAELLEADGLSPADTAPVGPKVHANRPSSAAARAQNGVYKLHVVRSQELGITVVAEGLPAGQAYHTRLILETNGGVVEIPVDFEVAAIPFAQEPFRGLADPRSLAKAMRHRAKDAARLLHAGVVQQWFEQNRWVWPVAGELAPGIAAVQQFYEALGLVAPPRLELEPACISCSLLPEAAQPVSYKVKYRSPDPKWIYAKVATTVPWLAVEPSTIYGPRETYFQVTVMPDALPRPGKYQTELLVEGNGGQRLKLPVFVEYPEPEVHRAVYMFMGSLVCGLAGAALRALLAWPDLLSLDRQRHWSVVGSLIPAPVTAAYRWLLTGTMALLLAVWTSWQMWRRERAWQDALSGLLGGGVLGLIAGLIAAMALERIEPMLAYLLQRAGAGVLPRFPGVALAIWYLIGSLVGVILAGIPPSGPRAIRALAKQYAALARFLGWKKVAAFFAMRWK